MAKPDITELEKAAIAARTVAFEEMFNHSMDMATFFSRSKRSVYNAEAGQRLVTYLTEKKSEIKARVTQ